MVSVASFLNITRVSRNFVPMRTGPGVSISTRLIAGTTAGASAKFDASANTRSGGAATKRRVENWIIGGLRGTGEPIILKSRALPSANTRETGPSSPPEVST